LAQEGLALGPLEFDGAVRHAFRSFGGFALV
jgi:hypothetical protein